MATTRTSKLKLGKPASGDTLWGTGVYNPNFDAIEALSPIAALAVTLAEIPSASLNVSVAAGSYTDSTGAKVTYAGTASQAITLSSTKVLYLDSTGALTVGTSYPTNAAHVPLATVVAGATTITSITDNRVLGGLVLRTLGSFANDAAAATGGVAIGGLYHTSGVVHIRLT
jgi:hypothetical protein